MTYVKVFRNSSQGVLLDVILLAIDGVAAYFLAFSSIPFVEAIGDMMLVEVAVLFDPCRSAGFRVFDRDGSIQESVLHFKGKLFCFEAERFRTESTCFSLRGSHLVLNTDNSSSLRTSVELRRMQKNGERPRLVLQARFDCLGFLLATSHCKRGDDGDDDDNCEDLLWGHSSLWTR